jgi:hypothetical protein
MGVTGVLGMDILLNRNLPHDSSDNWAIHFQLHAIDNWEAKGPSDVEITDYH